MKSTDPVVRTLGPWLLLCVLMLVLGGVAQGMPTGTHGPVEWQEGYPAARDGVATLRWKPAAGAVAYRVYRDGALWTVVDASTEPSVVLPAAEADAHFEVARVDGQQREGRRSARAAPAGIGPFAPSSLRIEAQSDQAVQLRWDLVEIPAGLRLYRAQNDECYELVAAIKPVEGGHVGGYLDLVPTGPGSRVSSIAYRLTSVDASGRESAPRTVSIIKCSIRRLEERRAEEEGGRPADVIRQRLLKLREDKNPDPSRATDSSGAQ